MVFERNSCDLVEGTHVRDMHTSAFKENIFFKRYIVAQNFAIFGEILMELGIISAILTVTSNLGIDRIDVALRIVLHTDTATTVDYYLLSVSRAIKVEVLWLREDM